MENECPHVSERVEDFVFLGLDVKGKRSIQESLELYVQGEVRSSNGFLYPMLYSYILYQNDCVVFYLL